MSRQYLSAIAAISCLACAGSHVEGRTVSVSHKALAEQIWEQRSFDYLLENETVYLIHAAPETIDDFNAAMVDWEGGQVFEANAKDEYEFYWAYSFRTAPQAREFMFTAMRMGVELTIGEFDQTHFQPEVRDTLDGIEQECAANAARLFVLPDRSVYLDPDDDAAIEEVRCLVAGLNEGGLIRSLRIDIETAPEATF